MYSLVSNFDYSSELDFAIKRLKVEKDAIDEEYLKDKYLFLERCYSDYVKDLSPDSMMHTTIHKLCFYIALTLSLNGTVNGLHENFNDLLKHIKGPKQPHSHLKIVYRNPNLTRGA